MVNLLVGFWMESYFSGDEVHMKTPIWGNRHVVVLYPGKSLAPTYSFIAFTLVQWINSRLDFFKSCGAFSWAASFPAFSNFRRLLSPAHFYLCFWVLCCLGFGLGCWLFFLEKTVVEWVQDVLTMLFHGNFPCWRSCSVSPRHWASPAGPSNLFGFVCLAFFFSQWVPCHRSTQSNYASTWVFFPVYLISLHVRLCQCILPCLPLESLCWLLPTACLVRGFTGLLNLLMQGRGGWGGMVDSGLGGKALFAFL